jgi:hypothetical protein
VAQTTSPGDGLSKSKPGGAPDDLGEGRDKYVRASKLAILKEKVARWLVLKDVQVAHIASPSLS